MQLVAHLVPARAVDGRYGLRPGVTVALISTRCRFIMAAWQAAAPTRHRRRALNRQPGTNRPRYSTGRAALAVASPFGPDAGQRALLADPRLILPSELQRLAAGVLWQGRVYEGGEVDLKDAGAAPSCPGYRGRV